MTANLGSPATADTTLDTARQAGSPRRRFWPQRPLRFISITLLSLVGPIAAIAAGTYLYLAGGRFVSTDNAYLKADKVTVSPDVSGRIESVHVKAHEFVRPGTLLFRIDPEPFQIALEQANARLTNARQEIIVLRHLYKQKLANLERVRADVNYYEQQFERQRELNSKRIASRANFDTAERELRTARDQVAILGQELAQVRAKLAGDPDIDVERHASVREAMAAVRKAQLELDRTEVRTSVNGIVTNFDLQKGEFVKAGDVAFSIVGTDDVWVQANYRETELTHVRVGQAATIRIDAYPDRVWTAVVDSISPATGAEFALLPPQNATGNWVKVVQRVGVHLRFKDVKAEPPLRAGMSALVEIDTRHKRKLGGFANAIVEWARQLI
jgi:membrane fusion protein, multidrug efflux system